MSNLVPVLTKTATQGPPILPPHHIFKTDLRSRGAFFKLILRPSLSPLWVHVGYIARLSLVRIRVLPTYGFVQRKTPTGLQVQVYRGWNKQPYNCSKQSVGSTSLNENARVSHPQVWLSFDVKWLE